MQNDQDSTAVPNEPLRRLESLLQDVRRLPALREVSGVVVAGGGRLPTNETGNLIHRGVPRRVSMLLATLQRDSPTVRRHGIRCAYTRLRTRRECSTSVLLRSGAALPAVF